MKKRFVNVLALALAVAVCATGCGGFKTAKAAIEYVGDGVANIEASAEASALAQAQQIVMEDLTEPAFEEASASASTSTVTKEEEVTETQEDQTVVVFFGDSQFANGRNDGSDLPNLISLQVPNSKFYNLAIGGTTAAVELSTDNIDPASLTSNSFVGMTYALAGTADRNKVLADYPNVLDKMNQVDPKTVDIYVIEYGANDFFSKIPLDATIYDDNYLHTYYGGLMTGVETLKRISPNAKIVLVTPFYGIYYDANGGYIGDSYIVSNGIDTLANYARKASNVIQSEELYDYDTMFQSHCDLYVDHADKYLEDGVHLTLLGRQVFARLFAHLINFMEGYAPYAFLEQDYIYIDQFDPNEDYRVPAHIMKEYYPEAYEKVQNGEYLAVPPYEE
ncbi:SGNH/GDSL hydrolase family protein [Butyrivibrio proteoclasticus]|uniref:SGNH/GDSL hydrolase family protein n=1 Tax=Butyrivibrio proteoclasticus TaxID=43305 RepID=UPI0004797BDD|nr:SGNH/GDSL hydrolase family protein [Butyrivibrio proteoclasticus]